MAGPSGQALSAIAYDDLTLAYNGNQLRKVTDAADVSTNSPTEQFLDFANTDTEYAYNTNGAMTKDLNKGISSISYNLLNLPQQIDILSPVAEARNAYSYSADGVKLRVVKKYNSNFNTSPVIGSAVNTSAMDVTQTTDYVDGKLFENNVLDRIFVDGGYIKGGTYYFYETDHLGDNRTVMNQSGTVVERNDYYPFGMQMAHNQLTNSASGSDNKRKFGNKELDVMGGLNLYDSQARMQDPTLGIFTTSDPLSEKKPWLSPYIYCSDNPLSRVDPDGRQDVVTTYEAYEAYAASTATTGSNMSAGQAIVELGNWLGHAYVHAVNQVIDKAVNSYKTITGQNKQSVSQTNGENKTQGTKERTAKDPLRRNEKTKEPEPDAEAKGTEHTQLGTKKGKNGDYKQGREFGKDDKPVRDIDHTDHGRPNEHPNRHQHKYKQNKTGGTLKRGEAEPL